MRFLKLTLNADGDKIFINVDQIVYIEQCKQIRSDKHGSVICTTQSMPDGEYSAIYVYETIEQIEQMLRMAGDKDSTSVVITSEMAAEFYSSAEQHKRMTSRAWGIARKDG